MGADGPGRAGEVRTRWGWNSAILYITPFNCTPPLSCNSYPNTDVSPDHQGRASGGRTSATARRAAQQAVSSTRPLQRAAAMGQTSRGAVTVPILVLTPARSTQTHTQPPSHPSTHPPTLKPHAARTAYVRGAAAIRWGGAVPHDESVEGAAPERGGGGGGSDSELGSRCQ